MNQACQVGIEKAAPRLEGIVHRLEQIVGTVNVLLGRAAATADRILGAEPTDPTPGATLPVPTPTSTIGKLRQLTDEASDSLSLLERHLSRIETL